MAQLGSGISGQLGLGAINAESASASNVKGGQLISLSGTNASSDERQQLSRKVHIFADIAEIGNYLRGWTPPKIVLLKLQPVDEVYPLLTGEAALDDQGVRAGPAAVRLLRQCGGLGCSVPEPAPQGAGDDDGLGRLHHPDPALAVHAQ